MKGVHATALGFDQSGGAQLGEVMADGRFRQPDRRREFAAVFLSVLVSSSDISRTRAGSAIALSRNATSRAAFSSTGAAATGAQQTGADMSITGNALGILRIYRLC